MRAKSILFRALPSLACLVAVATVVWLRGSYDPTELNREAWMASYLERGLESPPQGPREGYWGDRLPVRVPHPLLGWRDAPSEIEGLISTDERGMQHYYSAAGRRQRIVILGGSLAWGAYASTFEKAYFSVLGRSLESVGVPTEITVIAAGAWKSAQELSALDLYGDEIVDADLVVLLNGLNDLTNGARYDTLFTEVVATRDGSEFTNEYHEHDYEARVERYLENMGLALDRLEPLGVDVLVVLQPALTERSRPTPIEKKLLEYSLLNLASAEALVRSYEEMRVGLLELAERRELYFLDGSRILSDEPETTFADMWHFSDPGHEILAEFMTEPVASILRERKRRL